MNLITVAGLKSFAEIKDSHSDVFIGMLVEAMSERIERYLNRYLTKAQYTEYFEAGVSRTKYWLPAYPIDLTKDFIVTDSDVVLTINRDYYVREDQGLIEFVNSTTKTKPKQIKVVWTGGYEEINDSSIDDGTLDVPSSMKLGCYLQCSYMYKRRNDLGLMSISIAGGFTIGKMPAMALLPDVKEMLNKFRRVPMEY